MIPVNDHPTPPVLFLVFNRPDLARRVFARIREARPARLFIAADGPRPGRPDDVEACRESRLLAERVDWPCEVSTLFRETNLGCRAAVSSAISWFFERVEAGIVLEDDCLPDPSFFPFCSELLARYRDDARVTSIGGDCFFPGGAAAGYSYSFSAYAHIWGWATWRRAWKLYDPGLEAVDKSRAEQWLAPWLGSAAAGDYWASILRRYAAGEIDTWDYPWLFSCWRQRGMSIAPAVNLVSNIGFDSRGAHAGGGTSTAAGRPLERMEFPLRHPPEVVRDAALEKKTESLYHGPAAAPQAAWRRWAAALLRRAAFGKHA